MPNTLDPYSANHRAANDPTVGITNFNFGGEHNPYAELTEEIIFGAVNQMLGWIDDLTGLDLVDVVKPLENLLGTDVNLLTSLVTWLTPEVFTIGENVFTPLLTGIGVGSISSAVQWFYTLPINFFWNALSFGAVGNQPGNVLTNPNFLSPQSVSDTTGTWVWDADTSPDNETTGSVYTDADGTSKSLHSNMVDVSPSDTVNVSAKVKWRNATGTGTPIQLNVAKYFDGMLLGQQTVSAISSLTPQSDWVTLSGSYPVVAGVDRVAIQLTVDAPMTAGRVWFSDASYTKVGQMQQSWTLGITAGALSLEQDFLNVFGVFAGAGATLVEVEYAWTNVLSLFGAGVGAIATVAFDAAAFLESWVAGSLVPLGVLAQVGLDGLLIAAQAPQLLFDVVATVADAWTGLFTALNPVTLIAEALGGIFGTGQAAVASNAVQDAKISALFVGAGAVSLFDTFGGGSSTTLDVTHWEQTGFGPGSGYFGVDGSGNTVWGGGAGSAVYSYINRHLTALGTDTQGVSVSLANDIVLGNTTANNASVRLQARENASRTDRIEAFIDPQSCEIGYVLSGTYTRLGAAVTFSSGYSTSGSWFLKAGTNVGGAREFVLLHNDVEMVRRTDSSAVSAMDSSHRFTGFTVTEGVNLSVYYTFYNIVPPPCTSFAAADRVSSG